MGWWGIHAGKKDLPDSRSDLRATLKISKDAE
jgi:hypothetical protein